ncbi:MAG: hypothetical protein ACLS95_06675 [Clostridia bacterium]|jgi:Tfp pilus assembly protein PilE
MKKLIKQEGVTLVALVITIIILIILAGISINTLVGNNGIITKAQKAKENTMLAQEEEAKQLNELYSQLNIMGGNLDEANNEAINKLLEFKSAIATAITNEGVTTQETDSAEVMVSNIGKILLQKTKNATATAEDIKQGKTAWVNGELITGTGGQSVEIRTADSISNSSPLKIDFSNVENYTQYTLSDFIYCPRNEWYVYIGTDAVQSADITASYDSNTGIFTMSVKNRYNPSLPTKCYGVCVILNKK